MAQQFDYPKTETELREIQDNLYQQSKEAYDAGGRPVFKGLLEIMSAETTIITAIHNIKSNHGSETPGVDGKQMRKDYLQRPYPAIIREIQSAFRHFEAQKIRRKYIDKPGKAEKRPLGIPTIRDRIVQECMRLVLEPICEAQFFAHSYGFRPMRDTAMALERIKTVVHNTGDYIGFTALIFCKWEKTSHKNEAETPYSDAGRQKYFERTKKKRMQARLDELCSEKTGHLVCTGKWGKLNNFEFVMNLAYALNRDRLKCRVCGGWLVAGTPYTHRVNPRLPLDKVNRVNNLVSLHKECFEAINNPTADISKFTAKAQQKILGYREKLV